MPAGARTTERRRLRRRLAWLAAGLAGAAALGALLAGPPPWLLDRLSSGFPGCLYRVPTTVPVVSLTIDDGPDPETTPLILDELRRHGARATFFLIGERVTQAEPVVTRLVREGHELGNHMMSDRPSIRLDPETFGRDLARAGEALSRFGPVPWARPGAGWYTQAMVAEMKRQGYRCALGSVYPYDAALASARYSTRHVLRNVRPGAVVVLHDAGARGRRTVAALRVLLPALRARGYRIVTLSELTAPAGRSGR